jgi:hypothetical protein
VAAGLADVLGGIVDEAAVVARATALREADDHEDDHPGREHPGEEDR